MKFCKNQWTGSCMIGTYHKRVYECLRWLEKPLWLINVKFHNVIVTDMFHKYRIRSLQVYL